MRITELYLNTHGTQALSNLTIHQTSPFRITGGMGLGRSIGEVSVESEVSKEESVAGEESVVKEASVAGEESVVKEAHTQGTATKEVEHRA